MELLKRDYSRRFHLTQGRCHISQALPSARRAGQGRAVWTTCPGQPHGGHRKPLGQLVELRVTDPTIHISSCLATKGPDSGRAATPPTNLRPSQHPLMTQRATWPRLFESGLD